jgi:hypothetical protein
LPGAIPLTSALPQLSQTNRRDRLGGGEPEHGGVGGHRHTGPRFADRNAGVVSVFSIGELMIEQPRAKANPFW